jgi:Ca2+-transporting ATPase
MERGLTQHEVVERLKKFGKNSITAKSNFSVKKLFLSQFPTTINAILAIAGIGSFFINDSLDALFIFAVIIINACFGFVQEYRAQKSLEKLKQYTAPEALVIRDGKETRILAEDIVIDDIVILSEGDRVPADGVLIDQAQLEIDESILTGESLAVLKKKMDGIMLGTLVLKGNGLMKVTKIGMQTNFGKIAETMASLKDEQAPLQKNLDQFGKLLSYIAIAISLFIIPIGLYHHGNLGELILISASIAIAAIPEGLPAVITIAFAVGTNRMAKRGAIIRKMNAIETLGAVQVILSDKTGTMTQNSMRVKKYWLAEKETMKTLITACFIGNTASLLKKGNGEFDIVGDQTDGALKLWAQEQLKGEEILFDENQIEENVFDSQTQTITTRWKETKGDTVFVRGAPEAIIAKSTLSPYERKIIKYHYELLAKEGMRVIGFGTKKQTHGKTQTREQLEKNLQIIGFIGVYDPPRKEVAQAVKESRMAGIQAIMVTGDNALTALSLAKEIGLITEDEDVITGDTLTKMTDEEIGRIIFKTRVFARIKPEQKLRLVTVLKEKGIIVGVTGDGVNDALALKRADVGVAMGDGGTDVAKEASDIVLTDNNFATLIKAIEEGRVIYKNIVNAILYLISGNLSEILLIFIATIIHLPFPLLATQILWINLVTDSLPALALATGNKDETVLSKKPRNPQISILDRDKLLIVGIIGVTLTTILLGAFISLLAVTSEIHARTVVFNLLIFFRLVIMLGLGWQSVKRGNRFLILTFVIIALLQMIITCTPVFQTIFHLAV